MSGHTPGRLKVRGGYSIYASDNTPVADTCLTASAPANDEANARRLTACWNACERIPTEVLEKLSDGVAVMLPMYQELHAQREQLLSEIHKARAALKEQLEVLIQSCSDPKTGLITDDADLRVIESEQDLINSIDRVIARAEGHAPT